MILNVKVFPNSGKSKVIQLDKEVYQVYVKAPMENNKANIELIKVISKYFNTSSDKVKIRFGKKNKNKVIYIGN